MKDYAVFCYMQFIRDILNANTDVNTSQQYLKHPLLNLMSSIFISYLSKLFHIKYHQCLIILDLYFKQRNSHLIFECPICYIEISI